MEKKKQKSCMKYLKVVIEQQVRVLPAVRNGQVLHHGLSRWISCFGGSPNSRLYSLLNCCGLS